MLRVIRNALLKASQHPTETPVVTADPEEALRIMRDERPGLALPDYDAELVGGDDAAGTLERGCRRNSPDA